MLLNPPRNGLARKEEVSIILIRLKHFKYIPGNVNILHRQAHLNMYLSEVDTSYRNFKIFRGHSGRDRMVVGFTTTYAISAYHH